MSSCTDTKTNLTLALETGTCWLSPPGGWEEWRNGWKEGGREGGREEEREEGEREGDQGKEGWKSDRGRKER